MYDEIPQADDTAESVSADETSESPSADPEVVTGDDDEGLAEASTAESPNESDESSVEETDEAAGDDESARRAFLTQVLAGTIGAVVGLVPVLSGLVFFLDPLIRGDRSGDDQGAGSGVVKDGEGYIKLPVTRSLLPSDGTPQQVTVEDDLVDAWNKFPKVPIGSVWLVRSESGTVTAFSTICPHLGCAVEFRGARSDFYCPCHLSAFKLDGTKDNPIPPRDMDKLAVKPDTGEEIWVQYKNFRGGISEKVEI